MSRYTRLVLTLAVGFLGVGGCSSRSGDDSLPGETVSKAQLRLAATGVSAIANLYPGGSSFNANVVVTNTGTTPTTNWEVDIQLNNATVVGAPWNCTSSQSGTVLTLRSNSGNSVLAPGGTAWPGLNGAWNSTPYVNPTVIAVRRDVGSSGSGGASSGGAGGSSGKGGFGGTLTGGAAATGGKATGGAATGGAGTGGTSSGGAAGSAASGNAVATSGGSGASSGNNVALEKAATASSSLSGNPASYGNDASATTSWCAFSPAVYEWWSVDLGATYALTGTEVTWPQSGRVYQYFVSISSDGTNYSEVVNQRSNARTTQTQADSFTAQGRYLRLQVTGLATSPVTSACISDFKAFGTPVANSGSGGATGSVTTIGGATGSSAGGATTSSGGTLASGGTTGTTNSAGTTSGGASSSGGTSSTTSGGTTSVPTDRRRFTIRLPGGVRRQDAAVATDGGPLNIADNTQVRHEDGSYSSVTGMAMPDGSRIGVEAHVLNAWVDGNIQLANRTVVDSYAKATGTISREPDTQVSTANVFEQHRFTPPEVINWDVDFPLNPTVSASLGVGQTLNLAPGGYDVGYAPRDAHLRLAAGTYTFNRITIEDGGFIEVDNSAGPVFVYIRDFFAFRGRIDRTLAKANVLFGVAGTNAVSLERAFKGILVAPNAPVTLTSTVEHRGAFFGKGVNVLQNVTLVHEAFEPSNFCEAGAACSDFCPCGGDTCGESSCATGSVCGTNQGRRFGRASGISVCMDPSCVSGAGTCGAMTDICGLCDVIPRVCYSNADCLSGDVCGDGNGERMGRDSHLNVCWSAVCQAAPNTPPNCGGEDAACGACDCSAACATKACGDDSSDGCGGTCTGFCQNGLAGCKADADCPEGSVCGIQVGARFGFDSGANVCWPASCSMQDPSKPNAGVDAIACGVSPACTPTCEPDYTGPDGCGGFCGDCQSGDIRTSFGHCTPLVLNIWQSPWETYDPPPSAFYVNSAGGASPETAGTIGSVVTPEAATVVSPPTTTTPVGAVAGSFAVSDLGEATYTIPIVAPPGRNGMEPSISLSYRSNKVNGLMGFGWAIGGLSAISRCPQIFARDGQARGVKFDTEDRFCLDGEALIWVSDTSSGAIYRLETDPTSRIRTYRAVGTSTNAAPSYFTLETRDGRSLTYGGIGATITTSSNVGRVWGLSRVIDRSGNSMNIYYRRQTMVLQSATTLVGGKWTASTVAAVGELVPDVIGYGDSSGTGNGASRYSRFVKFDYEDSDRPDPVLHYMWGVAGFSKKRLKAIETFVSDIPVRKYNIAYRTDGPGGASLLGSVTECGMLGGEKPDGVCKPPTTFEYEKAGGGWGPVNNMFEQVVEKVDVYEHGNPPSDRKVGERYLEYRTLVLDVNGDGRDDVLQFSDSIEVGISYYYRCHLWVSNVGALHSDPHSSACYHLTHTHRYLVFDKNRDGKDDLVQRSRYMWLESTGNVSGTFDDAFKVRDSRLSDPYVFGQFDVDGNGFKDSVYCTGETDGYSSAWTALNDGVEFGDPYVTTRVKCGDFGLDTDRDGKEEWVKGIAVDFNGDGLREQAVGNDFGGFAVGINTGASADLAYLRFVGGRPQRFVSVDVEGDTFEELVSPSGAYRWKGPTRGLVYDATTVTPFGMMTRFQFIGRAWDAHGVVGTGDFNGDGTADLLDTGAPLDQLFWGDLPPKTTTVRYVAGRNTAKAGLLHGITDGLGKTTTIKYDQYLPATGSSATQVPVYSPDTCFSEARKTSHCLKKVGPVVSSHSEEQVSNGAHNPGPTYNYKYYGARRGVGGRNWFTFKKRSIETAMGLTEIEYYTDADKGESDPYGDKRFLVIGKVKQSTATTRLRQPANGFSQAVEAQTRTQADTYALTSGGTLAYLSARNATVAEDGAVLSRVEWKANAVDEFGAVTNDETKVSGGTGTSVTTVVRTITNDTSKWRIGQLDFETVTSIVGGRSTTREVHYGYDAKGRLEYIEREPNNAVDQSASIAASNPYLRTTFTRDAFGNIEKTTLQDSRGAAEALKRVTSVAQWTPDHILPLRTIDAMGHEMALVIAAATGQVLSVTDDNGAIASFRYDAFGRENYANTPQGIWGTVYSQAYATPGAVNVWGAVRTQTVSQGAGASTVTYDAYGRVVSTTATGVGTLVGQEFEYDQLGRLRKEARPHQWFSVPGMGTPASSGIEGVISYNYFVDSPRRASVELPDGNRVQYAYFNRNSAGGPAAALDWFTASDAVSGVAVVSPRGNISATVTNYNGRPVLRAHGDGDKDRTSIVRYAYGPFGAPLTVSGPGGTTSIATDSLGRPESSSDPSTGTTMTYYNGFGELVQQTNGNGSTVRNGYDLLGRRTEIRTSGDELVAKWLYDGSGINEKGRLIASYRQSAPGSSTGNWQRYHYQTDAYDESSRGMLTGITYGIGGNEAAVGADDTFTLEYKYTDPVVPWRATGIVYPAAGGSSFGVGLQYSNSGALTAIVSAEDPSHKYWELLSTDQGMRPLLERYGNGVQTTYNYYHLSSDGTNVPQCDAQAGVSSCMPGLMKGLLVEKPILPAATHLSMLYAYDGNGNLSVKSQEGAAAIAHQYAYDAQDRLIGDRAVNPIPGSPEVSNDAFAYDGAGNLTSKSGRGYDYDPAKPSQVLTAGDLSYTWDAVGNVLTRSGPYGLVPGGQQAFSYDYLNLPYRIVSNKGGSQTEFEYDAGGARVVKRSMSEIGSAMQTTSDTLDIGELYQLVRDYAPTVGTAPTRKEHHYRVFAGQRQVVEIVKVEDASGSIDPSKTTTRYLHQDHLGSGVVATDEDGDVQYRQEFDAFGSKVTSTWDFDIANSGYTGHQHDEELGIVNMRGRLYDAKLGRFLKADPFVTDPMSAAGLNRYSYVRNSPLNMVDPSGFENILAAAWHFVFGGGESEVTDRNGGGAEYDAAYEEQYRQKELAWENAQRAAPRARPATPQVAPREQSLSLAAPSESVHGVAAASSGGATGVQQGGQQSTSGSGAPSPYVAVMSEGERVALTLPLAMCLSTAGVNAAGAGLGAAWRWFTAGPMTVMRAAPVLGYGLPMVGGAVAARGGADAVRIGQAGETAVRAAVDIGPKLRIIVSGATRIPDGLTGTILSEVKNVGYQGLTQQLRDFLTYSIQNGLRFDLYVRPGAQLSQPLLDARAEGLINILEIPF